MSAYELGVPDTWLGLPPAPASNARVGVSQLRCGCLPDEGCPGCNGEGLAEWSDRKDAAAAVVARWKRGEITPEQYYHLSAGVDRDGMPSREAAQVWARAQERAARGDAA